MEKTKFPGGKCGNYHQLQFLESSAKPLSPGERLRALNRPLLHWYENHARILPWRERPEPYRVWISEIMLQQTRVEAVKPYFERFMKELPTVEALAAVPEDRLMKLWEGLGYYNRARNLQKAARQIVMEFDGQLPADFADLLTLPGIGSYTAGAIASIAFGQPVPAVDGNVLRVISRVLASREDILKQTTKTWMEQMLVETMPKEAASSFNQGLIEIGAMVCVPNGPPKCGECPLESLCLARREGILAEIPVKKRAPRRKVEERTVCLIEYQNQIGIRRRPDSGLLAALYELPNRLGYLPPDQLAAAFSLPLSQVAEIEELPAARHIFSHVEWHMIGYRVILKQKLPECYIAVEKQQVKAEYALPNAFSRYTKLIK